MFVGDETKKALVDLYLPDYGLAKLPLLVVTKQLLDLDSCY